MIETNWLTDTCPICRRTYHYPEDGYRPKTCGDFDCVHKFLHPEIFDPVTRKQLEELRAERR